MARDNFSDAEAKAIVQWYNEDYSNWIYAITGSHPIRIGINNIFGKEQSFLKWVEEFKLAKNKVSTADDGIPNPPPIKCPPFPPSACA